MEETRKAEIIENDTTHIGEEDVGDAPSPELVVESPAPIPSMYSSPRIRHSLTPHKNPSCAK